MCGIFGLVQWQGSSQQLRQGLRAAQLINHRGPDHSGEYVDECFGVGLVHKRLAVIDLSESGHQPMQSKTGHVIIFNGEIINYREIREVLHAHWSFKTQSDTEVILAAYLHWGESCLDHFRGMFAFAIYHPKDGRLFCARDRFGIKPFYYLCQQNLFVFASEMKALLPFLPSVRTHRLAFQEYLTFQYTLGEQTLFDGIKQLMPGHCLHLAGEQITITRYWDVDYRLDYQSSEMAQQDEMRDLLEDSVRLHVRSDVPIASYLSGGMDSSLITQLAQEYSVDFLGGFHGKFLEAPAYDESAYAKLAADYCGKPLFEKIITADDFIQNLESLIYHLDTPVAGPGAFPQYMVSQMAAKQVKVILGGQGADEIFGGYARYLLAYFEQTIKAAIEGKHLDKAYVVTPQSIIPNLNLLKQYKPMMQQFWREGMFESMDKRYFRLIDRSVDMRDEIDHDILSNTEVFARFQAIFNNKVNVREQAYFDKMTHFDFKCLLPALLHVEDRVSMAHGLESRAPFLDHPLVEQVATIPAIRKFPGGKMKHLLSEVFKDSLPRGIVERRKIKWASQCR